MPGGRLQPGPPGAQFAVFMACSPGQLESLVEINARSGSLDEFLVAGAVEAKCLMDNA